MAGGAGKLKGLMDAKIWLYENIKEASSCDREIEKVWQWVDIKKRRIKEKVTILLCIGNNNDSNDPQIRNIVYWIDIRIRLIWFLN